MNNLPLSPFLAFRTIVESISSEESITDWGTNPPPATNPNLHKNSRLDLIARVPNVTCLECLLAPISEGWSVEAFSLNKIPTTIVLAARFCSENCLSVSIQGALKSSSAAAILAGLDISAGPSQYRRVRMSKRMRANLSDPGPQCGWPQIGGAGCSAVPGAANVIREDPVLRAFVQTALP